MDIKRGGSEPSAKGPTEYFTASVRVDTLFRPQEPARTSGAYVTFEPGARTAWHTHPLGQTLDHHRRLRLGAARGRSDRGNPARRCRAGFRLARSTGTARRPTTAMTHIAITEALNGKNVDWMEKVSDEQYRK